MTGAAGLPPFAHVPGRNARHPEGYFDAIRASVRQGMTQTELAGTAAFITGLRWLDQGYDWEAHELLEPVWMVLPQKSVARAVVQGLIQLANARLKLRMGKPRAARRLLQIAAGHLAAARGEVVMGIAVADYLRQVETEIMQYNA